MKVKDLIKELQTCDPEFDIEIVEVDGGVGQTDVEVKQWHAEGYVEISQ